MNSPVKCRSTAYSTHAIVSDKKISIDAKIPEKTHPE